MAMGARKAFNEINEAERARWIRVPFTGCDGMPKHGQAWVRNGMMAATIFIRPNTDLAIEMLVEAIKSGKQLPEQQTTMPESVPSLAELAEMASKAADENKAGRSAGA